MLYRIYHAIPPVQGVDEVLFNEQGKAWAIKTGNEIAKAPLIIGDPSYFPREKTRSVGQVVRAICLLDHPIGGTYSNA